MSSLTEAYRLKSIALSQLQAIARFKKVDPEKLKAARKRYATMCKQYEDLMKQQLDEHYSLNNEVESHE